MPKQSWIFQANPTIYRARDAVAVLSQLTWSVKQHRDAVQLGDSVYLWESGPSGGLVARATIASAVGEHPELSEELPFWNSPPTGEKSVNVLLSIDEVFPPIVKRADLLNDPDLAGMRLLKMPQGTNYLLTAKEAAALERLTAQKPTLQEVLRQYHAEGVVFPSIERGAQFYVQSIDDGGCEIARLSAREPARVTWSLHDKRVEELRASGAEILTPDLDGTAAIRATLIQSPLLGLSANRDHVRLVETDAAAGDLLCELLVNLTPDRAHGPPKLYKPAMLAALVEAIGADEIRDHRIKFDVLLPRFLAKLESLGQTGEPKQAAYAFYHLTGELFWHLAYFDVERRVDANNVSPTSIRERVRHAVLKEPFRRILGNAAFRERVLKTLAENWWPLEELPMQQRRFWWVNQGGSYEKERAHGTIWCPQVDKAGGSPHHWVNVSQVRRGDFLFHCAKGEVRSLSIAVGDAAEGNKPREIAIGDEWQAPGWYAPVDYQDLKVPVVHKDLKEMWRRLEIPGGPFNKHGSVNQGYLFPLNDRAVCLLAGQVVPAQPLPPEFVAAIDEAQQRVWDEFLDWGRQFLETGSIRDEERSWKLAGSANVAAVRAAFESGDPAWLDAMKRAFAKNNWATDYRTHDDLLRWWNDHPDAARRAAAIIWDRNSEPATCIAGFWNEIPREVVSGNGTQAAVASFLFGERAAEQFPLFRSEPYQAAYALTGCWRKTLTVTETYQWALEFLDRVIAEASQRGLTLVDRLDAQTLLWCVVKHEPPEQWSEERRQALLHYRAGKQVARAESVPPRDPIAELAERLLLPRTFIEETGRLLESKGQVVFYGPPGTGKTFVARELARYFAGDPDNVEIVQFHPSYTYEDFVEGFRPRSKGEQVGFELVRGPLRRLARRAAKDPTGKYVLLIDEINRGNVAKVFGELYFLLEYRNERIRLQYDHRRTFSLPDNLWIIGTMNTADRSIALMDAALRRRFFFLPFFPDEPPIAGLLHRWLERHRPQMLKVAPIVERANKLLGERHGAIGPSHFLRLDLDDHWLSLIWKHAVMPYLAEQFFGEEERLKAFTLEALQAMNDAPAELQA